MTVSTLSAFAVLAASAAGLPQSVAPPPIGGSSGLFGAFTAAPERVVRFAQHSPIPPRNRSVSDAQGAYNGGRSGENRSFEELMRAAHARGRGEYLGVEPDISRNVYRFKFMRPSGNVVWVDVDGRTARVLAEQD